LSFSLIGERERTNYFQRRKENLFLAAAREKLEKKKNNQPTSIPGQ
jgi:hypothetical protein